MKCSTGKLLNRRIHIKNMSFIAVNDLTIFGTVGTGVL